MKMRNTNNNQDIEGGNSDTMFVVDDDIDDVDDVDDDDGVWDISAWGEQ